MHLLISTCIIYVLVLGFKTILVVRGIIDFSYMACILIAAYIIGRFSTAAALPMLVTGVIALLLCLPCMFLFTSLSRRLHGVYYVVGTLGIYMISLQAALHLDVITGGALGLSGITRVLVGSFELSSLPTFSGWLLGVLFVLVASLRYIQKSFIYATIRGRGEHELVISSLGLRPQAYHLFLLLISTLCAVVGTWMYVYYYQFLDPSSFWFSLLLPILMASFLAYKTNLLGTFLYTLLVVVGYEGLRFVKIVDSSSVGYVREMLFGVAMIVVGYRFMKRFVLGRMQ